MEDRENKFSEMNCTQSGFVFQFNLLNQTTKLAHGNLYGCATNLCMCIHHQGQEVYERDVIGKQSLPILVRKSQIVFFFFIFPLQSMLRELFSDFKKS